MISGSCRTQLQISHHWDLLKSSHSCSLRNRFLSSWRTTSILIISYSLGILLNEKVENSLLSSTQICPQSTAILGEALDYSSKLANFTLRSRRPHMREYKHNHSHTSGNNTNDSFLICCPTDSPRLKSELDQLGKEILESGYFSKVVKVYSENDELSEEDISSIKVDFFTNYSIEGNIE